MGYVEGDDMSKLIAITGVSSVGKTSIAYEVARKMNASVICGDKVQIIAGYPIITGASDRDKYRTGSFLYGASTTRMTRSAWRKAVSGIITAIGGDFVIDGLAWFYMREAISLGATIYRLNVNPDLLPSLFRKRLDKAISSGLLDEVRRGQRDENLIKESSIAEILSMYTRGETSLDEAKNRLIEHSVSRAAIKVKDSDNFARLFVEMDHSPEKREATISSILANEIRVSMGYVEGDDMSTDVCRECSHRVDIDSFIPECKAIASVDGCSFFVDPVTGAACSCRSLRTDPKCSGYKRLEE